MASPKLEPLVLSDDERQVLEGWARRRTTGQGLARRSRIILACDGGASVTAVAESLGISRLTAAKWRSRFVRGRLEALADQPRPGRPRTITDVQVEQVVTATLEQAPPGGDARWSTRSMARQAGMSQTAISRIWRAFGLKPHSTIDRKEINNSIHYREVLVADQARAEDDRTQQGGTMTLAAERRDLLLARLARDGKLVAKDLAAELGLSDDSIRRDLRELAAAGLCQRVYGGALPAPLLVTKTHTQRTQVEPESKQRVGAAAAALIRPGSTVILDNGTTALEVVAALPPDLDATIITHSATTAAALASHPTVNVFLLGGHLNKQNISTWGATAAEAAAAITADLALLVLPGIHPQAEFTTGKPEDAAMKRILISRAAETYVMASIDKLGTAMPYKITDLPDVTGIITDASATDPTIQQLRQRGATFIHAA